MKMNKLDKTMVFWMILQFVALVAKSDEEWADTTTDSHDTNNQTWVYITMGNPRWFSKYIGLDFMFETISGIRRQCASSLELVFANVCAEVCDNAKK
jgi:hypothetical protein